MRIIIAGPHKSGKTKLAEHIKSWMENSPMYSNMEIAIEDRGVECDPSDLHKCTIEILTED